MKMNSNHLRSASFKSLCALGAFCVMSGVAQSGEPRFTPNAALELRSFMESPAYDEQFDHLQPSLTLGGEGRWVSDDRKKRVRFEPFLRLDGQDSERTHFDIRELTYSQRFSDFDLLVGNGQIFWGVAESRNVVDVINQFDTVENNDETDKLGQPLIRLGKFTDFGRFEAFYLPYFRDRTFPGTDGRQRGALVVDTDKAEYERGGEELAGDFALRYKHQIDKFDIGGHLFYGTSRAPFFKANTNGTRLIPIYQELAQGGFDIQWTSDEWLLKFEGITANQSSETYATTVFGFEYTFFDVQESGIDVGLLAEGLFDTRDETQVALNLFENDVFLGSRITWNDVQESELLFGGIIDVETQAVFGSVEYQTRIGDNMKFEAELQLISARDEDPIYQQRRDSNLTLRLTRYF